MIKTNENEHNSNIFSFINFLLLMFIGLIIPFIVIRVYYYGISKSSHSKGINIIILIANIRILINYNYFKTHFQKQIGQQRFEYIKKKSRDF